MRLQYLCYSVCLSLSHNICHVFLLQRINNNNFLTFRRVLEAHGDSPLPCFLGTVAKHFIELNWQNPKCEKVPQVSHNNKGGDEICSELYWIYGETKLRRALIHTYIDDYKANDGRKNCRPMSRWSSFISSIGFLFLFSFMGSTQNWPVNPCV